MVGSTISQWAPQGRILGFKTSFSLGTETVHGVYDYKILTSIAPIVDETGCETITSTFDELPSSEDGEIDLEANWSHKITVTLSIPFIDSFNSCIGTSLEPTIVNADEINDLLPVNFLKISYINTEDQGNIEGQGNTENQGARLLSHGITI